MMPVTALPAHRKSTQRQDPSCDTLPHAIPWPWLFCWHAPACTPRPSPDPTGHRPLPVSPWPAARPWSAPPNLPASPRISLHSGRHTTGPCCWPPACPPSPSRPPDTTEDALTAPASVTVIDREHIQNRASDDLLDAVQDTPGLSLSPRQAGGRKTFSLRGMNDAHTLMLVDGRRISATVTWSGTPTTSMAGCRCRPWNAWK